MKKTIKFEFFIVLEINNNAKSVFSRKMPPKIFWHSLKMKAFVDVSKKLAQVLPFICIFAWLFVLYWIKDIKCKMNNTTMAFSIMDAKNVAKIFLWLLLLCKENVRFTWFNINKRPTCGHICICQLYLVVQSQYFLKMLIFWKIL